MSCTEFCIADNSPSVYLSIFTVFPYCYVYMIYAVAWERVSSIGINFSSFFARGHPICPLPLPPPRCWCLLAIYFGMRSQTPQFLIDPFNLSHPTGYFMYQQVQHSKTIRSAHHRLYEGYSKINIRLVGEKKRVDIGPKHKLSSNK
jgi:hypothetical protein